MSHTSFYPRLTRIDVHATAWANALDYLSNLTTLQTLDLRGMQYVSGQQLGPGTIPSSWGLTGLTYLNLMGVNLSGTLPPGNAFPSLVYLQLSSNPALAGIIPAGKAPCRDGSIVTHKYSAMMW